MAFPKVDTTIRRILIIVALIIALMVPQGMVQDLIVERQDRRSEAASEMESSWGGDQVVQGPVLTVPFIHTVQLSDDKKQVQFADQRANFHFLPEQLTIASSVQPEIRYRGIFQFVLFQSALQVSGAFPALKLNAPGYNISRVLWQEAFITMGIAHTKGVRKKIELLWGEQKIGAEPGTRIPKLVDSGVTMPVQLNDSQEATNFSLKLELNGTGSLRFAPVGRESTVTVTSPWSSPNFSGEFLPVSREVNSDGFSATWQILNLNRNYPQEWVEEQFNIDQSMFGVGLAPAVDNYQQSTRSIKYSLLFIVTTFVAFFLVELLYSKRIHHLQYLMVGAALVLFYTLLVSISEHFSFDSAYLVAALAVTTMIGGYSSAILRSRQLGLLLGGLLLGLYVFLYLILQMEKYSLLGGSIGLFVMLATVMYLTRNINWFNVEETKTGDEPVSPPVTPITGE